MPVVSATESLLEEDYFIEVAALARRHARRRLLTDDVEDVVQGVVLAALTSMRAGDVGMITRGLNGYVDMLVVRRIYDDVRTDNRRARRDALYEREISSTDRLWMSPDLALDAQELQHVIALAIDAMTPLRRRVYLLATDDAATEESAAAALGMKQNAVHSQVQRALRQLRRALSQYVGLSEVVPIKLGRPRTRRLSREAAA